MHVIHRIDRFLRENRISAATFGRTVARDPRLVYDLRRGRQPGERMVARIESHLAGASA